MSLTRMFTAACVLIISSLFSASAREDLAKGSVPEEAGARAERSSLSSASSREDHSTASVMEPAGARAKRAYRRADVSASTSTSRSSAAGSSRLEHSQTRATSNLAELPPEARAKIFGAIARDRGDAHGRDLFLESARLTGSDTTPADLFSVWVAINGDTVVIGANQDDLGDNEDQGSAYVFVKPVNGWTGQIQEQAKLTASDGAAGDLFGNCVAISGDTIVIGAPTDDIGNKADRGSAYVFVKPVGGWSGQLHQQAKLTASDGAAGDFFGSRVAIDGNTVAVGATRDKVGTNAMQGSAYVFLKPSTGWKNMTQSAMLTASDGTAQDRFGIVAIAGQTIVVGASALTADPQRPGAGYVFVEPPGGWIGHLTQQAKLTASDGQPNDFFGYTAAISGDTVVLGAPGDNLNNVLNEEQGSAYVFVRPAQGGWSGPLHEQSKLTAEDAAVGDDFGDVAVAISDDTIVVGALFDDVGSNADQGSAYVFAKPEAGWNGPIQSKEKLTASDGAAGDGFGNPALDGDTLVVGGLSGVSYVFGLVRSTPTPTATPTETATPTATATATPTPTALTLPGDGSVSQQLTVTDRDQAIELTFRVVAPPIPGGCAVSAEAQPPSGQSTIFPVTEQLQIETIPEPEVGVWTITARSGASCPQFSYYLFVRAVPKVPARWAFTLALALLASTLVRRRLARARAA